MACTGIAENVAFTCNSTDNVAGVEDLIVLFRWSDIDKGASTFDGTNPLKLQSIAAVGSPLVGYSYESGSNGVNTNWENVADGFNPSKYIHRVVLPIYGDSADTGLAITKLINDKVVAVVFTRSQQVLVYGWQCGLTRPVATKDQRENENSYQLTLQTAETTPEPYMPFWYVGSSSPAADFEALKAEILAFVA